MLRPAICEWALRNEIHWITFVCIFGETSFYQNKLILCTILSVLTGLALLALI